MEVMISGMKLIEFLRNEAIKQIVVFSKYIGKPGAKKELAIGDVVGKKLSDPKFIIPIHVDDIPFSDAPPEFLRVNILEAYPNWHDCLNDLFETLENVGIPKQVSPDGQSLHAIVEAREEGRRFVLDRPEQALTNWFSIKPPERIRYYKFDGVQEQLNRWLADCRIPHIKMLRLVGTFADPLGFAEASSFQQALPTAYDIPFADFITGESLGPYFDRASASNDVPNLLRQHFDHIAQSRGLLPVEFASRQIGWFFPDGLLPANKIAFSSPDGRRIRRAMSGKFKKLRWHVCLIAKPRIWPEPVYRIHANVVLSEDGKKPLPGDETHKRRRRLTKSWWNNVWRDRLLAAMHFLSDGQPSILLEAGNDKFEVATWPLLANVPVSYEATDPPLPTEEDEEGNIVPTDALDDQADDLDDFDESGGDDDEEHA